jgi:hypothetical protein
MVCLFFLFFLLLGSKITAQQIMYTTDNLILRKEPSVNSQRIRILPVNTRVIILEIGKTDSTIGGITSKWYKVLAGNEMGWVFGGYLSGAQAGPTVEAVKITNDIDSTFKVQAEIPGGMWVRENKDLGIVGSIENGRLSLSLPATFTEEQLSSPTELDDVSYGPPELKIARIYISTSKSPVVLRNPQSGGDVTLWYANMDGDIDFYGNVVSFKKGWNFIEGFQGTLISGGKVWTTLQDVYDQGYYRWELDE